MIKQLWLQNSDSVTKEVIWWEQVIIPDLKNQLGGNSLLSDVQAPEVRLPNKREKCRGENMLGEDKTSNMRDRLLTVIALYKTTSQNCFCQKCSSIFVGFLRFLSSANSCKSQWIFAAMSLSSYQITLILHSDFSLRPSAIHKTTVHRYLSSVRQLTADYHIPFSLLPWPFQPECTRMEIRIASWSCLYRPVICHE